ncbi:thiamine pyrophosphate-requiring protein [Brevibacterium album]|uniref:thiamine pyrophosphate-requiring protein n=1 Tax=Brevibacterium album TaxID=417948 RepID=UPI000412D9A5|nr:thiamine pyrophosphate-requiring protein [Brevibacterium album]
MTNEANDQVADLLVRRLRDWEVSRVYGYSGDGNNPLLGALRRSSDGPRFISARHEEGAAFMAVGAAKYGGGVGVVTSTQGPGAVHLLTGLYDAKLDSVPVVALVAQQHRSVLGSDYQQEIDLQNLFGDVAAPFVQLVASPEQVPMVIDRAFRSAAARRQPAVVILPHDVQQAPAPELGQAHGEVVTEPRWATGRVLPDERDLDAAAEVIEAGERVALLVGQGARNAWPEVVQFAERTGAGITTSLLGKPYVDERHPLAAGTMGHLGTDASAHVLQGCDTLVIVGSNDPWTEFYPPPGAARAVQLDIDPAMPANRYPVEVGVIGDAAPTLRVLSSRLRERGRTPWREEVEAACARWSETARLRSEVAADPLNPELVVRAFGARLPDRVHLAVDVGSSVYHYVRQVRLPTEGHAHLSSTLASMGCGIPYGLAAKLEAPDAPVAVIIGDGGFQMLGVNELITVAALHTEWEDQRFVILVLGNRDLSEVTWEQREMENHPRFASSQDVPQFDAAGYAELLGLTGLRADGPESLEKALDAAFAATAPVVIDARTDGDVPLLPPPPHVDAKVEGIRAALAAEGEAGVHALSLLDEYLAINRGTV